jgi:iron(III) transport system ATP-binding protein
VLVIEEVSHRFGQIAALKNISFHSAGGEVTCLIGHSGCGKTTLLRLIAGLLSVQSGAVVLDGAVLANPGVMRAPERRSVGMVFQEGALFPHMSVADNVAFGLDKKGAQTRAIEWLERVGLAGLGDRYPDSLSGGQRQRVALARAMAPGPRVLLFDEPYANLDAPLRRSLRKDARRIIQETGAVGLFVTHDSDEVLMMADNVVVLDQGVIVETGSSQTLYEKPKSRFSAELFGEPQVLEGTIHNDGITTPVGEWERGVLTDPASVNGDASLIVGADQLDLQSDAQGLIVTHIHSVGRLSRITLRGPCDESTIALDCPNVSETQITVGSRVRVVPRPGVVFAAHRQGG